MAKRYSARTRFSYWFDNLMSQGTSAKIRLLITGTLIYIVVVGLIAAFFTTNNDGGVAQTLWKTMLYVIGKGVPSLDGGSPLFVLLSLLNVFYCLFFTAILIGLINQGIRSRMDKISKGKNKVLEEGHVLILGYNDATLVLLEQLIEANRNQAKQQRVVILDEIDWQEMTDAIRLRFGRTANHPKTKILCRTGTIFGFDDLSRCSLETSRVVIVNGNTDFDNVRAIIACTHLLGKSSEKRLPYLVSVIHDPENIAESSIAIENAGADGVLEYLALNETLARIMVHTSRKPGLSEVFTELFNYENDEFYIVDEDPGLSSLRGRSIAEINLMLKASFAVGKIDASGDVVIAPPRSVVFNDGDSLIVVKEDDDPLVIADSPVSVAVEQLHMEPVPDSTSVLIFGVQPMLDAVLAEYANYLHAGSIVHIADSADRLENIMGGKGHSLPNDHGMSIQIHEIDASKGSEVTRLLSECTPDSVLVLVDHNTKDLDADDERAVRILMYLREHRRRTGRYFSITSEIHKALNKELVSITGPDDFIISSHISSLLMAQISQRREMASVFRELLSSDGFEIYMRKASQYVRPDQPMDLHSVSEAVADKGEVFIGFRLMRNGEYEVAEVNPSKYVSDMQTIRKYTFSKDDYFVVLAGLES